MQSQGQGGLIPLFTELRNEITTQSYSNAFLLVGLAVLVAMPLAFFLPKRKPGGGGGAAPVEM
jgi:hypothetical protein